MDFRTLFSLFIMATVFLSIPSTVVKAAPPTSSDIIGTWKSTECEPAAGGAFTQREFLITAERWTGIFTNFADAECTQKTLIFRTEGPYEVLGTSGVAADTSEANFTLESVELTPHVEQIVDYLNSAAPSTCGNQTWQIHQAQDVTATGGCSVFGLSLPVIDHDIIKREGDQLFFGARPADGSVLDTPEKRPTTFSAPVALIQADPGSDVPAALPVTSTEHLLPYTILIVLAGILFLASGFSFINARRRT